MTVISRFYGWHISKATYGSNSIFENLLIHALPGLKPERILLIKYIRCRIYGEWRGIMEAVLLIFCIQS